jgi:hypothetical protein
MPRTSHVTAGVYPLGAAGAGVGAAGAGAGAGAGGGAVSAVAAGAGEAELMGFGSGCSTFSVAPPHAKKKMAIVSDAAPRAEHPSDGTRRARAQVLG